MQELNPIKPRHSRLLKSAVQRETVRVNWAAKAFFKWFFLVCVSSEFYVLLCFINFCFVLSMWSRHRSFLKYGRLWKIKVGNLAMNWETSQVSESDIIISFTLFLFLSFKTHYVWLCTLLNLIFLWLEFELKQHYRRSLKDTSRYFLMEVWTSKGWGYVFKSPFN